MPITQLLYVSSLINEYGHDLPHILRSSTHNNQAQGVAALLLCRNGNAMQLIEGPGKALRATYDRIRHDPRHFGLLVMLDEPIDACKLTGTSAGLHVRDADFIRQECKGLDLFQPTTAEIDRRVPSGTARDLLQQFVENNFSPPPRFHS
jgi:hypothetical protein